MIEKFIPLFLLLYALAFMWLEHRCRIGRASTMYMRLNGRWFAYRWWNWPLLELASHIRRRV